MNMPPVSMPVRPELVMSIITMALAVPSNGTSEVSSVLTPSLGSKLRWLLGTTRPFGALGPSSLFCWVSEVVNAAPLLFAMMMLQPYRRVKFAHPIGWHVVAGQRDRFLAVFIDDAGAISAIEVGNPHMSGGNLQTHVIT